jgi:uncharacterized protein YcfJ
MIRLKDSVAAWNMAGAFGNDFGGGSGNSQARDSAASGCAVRGDFAGRAIQAKSPSDPSPIHGGETSVNLPVSPAL